MQRQKEQREGHSAKHSLIQAHTVVYPGTKFFFFFFNSSVLLNSQMSVWPEFSKGFPVVIVIAQQCCRNNQFSLAQANWVEISSVKWTWKGLLRFWNCHPPFSPCHPLSATCSHWEFSGLNLLAVWAEAGLNLIFIWSAFNTELLLWAWDSYSTLAANSRLVSQKVGTFHLMSQPCTHPCRQNSNLNVSFNCERFIPQNSRARSAPV